MSRATSRRTRSLAELRSEFQANTEAASRLVRPLDGSQLVWRPPSGGWSIAECLDHLEKTASAYLARLEKRVEAAPEARDGTRHRHRIGFLAWQFKALMEPPARTRLPAPRTFKPDAIERLGSVVDRFEASRRRYEDLLSLAATRRWWAARAPNPLIPGVRLGVGDWLAIMAAHDRRHLWQAERLTTEAAFPARPERTPIVL